MIELRTSAWQRVPAGATVIIPLGSTEQHGPHLPLSTDTDIAASTAAHVAHELSKSETLVVLAPPLGYGASGEHQGFPGTISIGTEALTAVLIETVRSISTWGERVLFINGHGGNTDALASAVPQLIREQHLVAWVACEPPAIQSLPTDRVDAHAGRVETSLMLALRPDSVELSQAHHGNTSPLSSILPEIRQTGVQGVSPNGILGDPTGSSASEGQAILDAMVHQILAGIATWHVDSRGRLMSS